MEGDGSERGRWRDSAVGLYMAGRGHFTNFGLACEPDESPTAFLPLLEDTLKIPMCSPYSY